MKLELVVRYTTTQKFDIEIPFDAVNSDEALEYIHDEVELLDYNEGETVEFMDVECIESIKIKKERIKNEH